jgi:hypothetical protein
LRRGIPVSSTLVAGELGLGSTASRKVEEITRMRRVVHVSVLLFMISPIITITYGNEYSRTTTA